MKASKIGRLTCSSVIHSVKICMIISGSRPHSIQVGSMGAWLKAVLLLCVRYEPVANFSLVLTHGISLAPLTCFISACFRPGQNSSVERYFKDGYHSTDYLLRTAQYPFTFLFTTFLQSSFFIRLASRSQQEGRSYFTRIFLTSMYQLQLSEPLTASCRLASFLLLFFFFFFFFFFNWAFLWPTYTSIDYVWCPPWVKRLRGYIPPGPPAGTWRLYNVGSTSMQRHDVASTLRRRCINVMCLLGRNCSR